MKATIEVWSLAADDDSGTRAEVFTTALEAVSALLDWLDLKASSDPGSLDHVRQKLIDEFFDPDGDFYESIREYKSDLDTYSIDSHKVAVELPPTSLEASALLARSPEKPQSAPGESLDETVAEMTRDGALAVLAAYPRTEPSNVESAIRGTITNVLHLVKHHGLDPEAMVFSALKWTRI